MYMNLKQLGQVVDKKTKTNNKTEESKLLLGQNNKKCVLVILWLSVI